jgi:tRNA(Arg) A34 adenosine deaminase TadA
MPIEHELFMAAALQEAKRARDLGNIAAGSVIVRDGEILARGYNEVSSSFDITAHAEARAVRSLTMTHRQINPGSQADSGPFAGSILYSTASARSSSAPGMPTWAFPTPPKSWSH